MTIPIHTTTKRTLLTPDLITLSRPCLTSQLLQTAPILSTIQAYQPITLPKRHLLLPDPPRPCLLGTLNSDVGARGPPDEFGNYHRYCLPQANPNFRENFSYPPTTCPNCLFGQGPVPLSPSLLTTQNISKSTAMSKFSALTNYPPSSCDSCSKPNCRASALLVCPSCTAKACNQHSHDVTTCRLIQRNWPLPPSSPRPVIPHYPSSPSSSSTSNASSPPGQLSATHKKP